MSIPTFWTSHIEKFTTFVLGEWHNENIDINYVQENPMLRHEHAARMRLQLELTLGSLMGTSLLHYTTIQLYRELLLAVSCIAQL